MVCEWYTGLRNRDDIIAFDKFCRRHEDRDQETLTCGPMVRLRAIDIIYGNPQGVYRAGDLVQGHVILDFSEQLKLRSEFDIEFTPF